MAKVTLNFSDVKLHIKEFQKVYILGGCSLVFYKPNHLEARYKANGKVFKSEDGKKIHKEQEIVKMNSQESQEEKGEKEEIIGKEAAKAYAEEIDKEFNALTENTYKEKINTQSQENRKNKFKDYDIFYDVYTNQDNIKNYIKKFEVEDGIVTIPKSFLQECLSDNEKWCIIPRLISEQTDEDLHFDPVPLEDKGFTITDFHNTKEKDLTFQRRIAEIKNPDLTLQTPKEFHRMLNENRDFTQEDKLAQAQAIQKACELRVSEMEKIILKQDKSLKDIINDEKKLKEKIENLRKEPNRTTKETSLLGRLEFLQMNKKKAKDYGDIVENFENNEKPIHSKDIGDTGECVASLLFEKKSTRHLSNRRKLDANFNANGFNHTIPDFLVTLNDYPALVEVKNVQTQSLTEQISFELKLAREYELDYLFLCNHYTQLMDNITGLAEFNSGNKDHTGSRKGFIYHKHANRSIKTIFKEIYLHHIKGAAPNKIMIKRLNLNDSNKLEEK
ncbi:putative toxin [Helicobacter sp. UBA3407]|uniref:putative toxin n=1 Tax=Helicobacter sp. UBA3407 TaxID=1946588 RepID=UPI002621B552|nr:putative toxin [Helicobacter sp. UBA3407]